MQQVESRPKAGWTIDTLVVHVARQLDENTAGIAAALPVQDVITMECYLREEEARDSAELQHQQLRSRRVWHK